MKKAMEIFGLTNTEGQVYSTLLKLGPSTAGVLAKKSGIHRRTAYDATERLIEKGLISYMVKNNKKFFTPVDPENLLNLIKEREEQLKEILPELKVKYEGTIKKQETLFFRGKNGLKTIFEDQLKTKEEIKVLGASPLAYAMMKYYVHWFNKKREKQKIPMKLLYTEDHRKERPLKFTKTKYLANEFSSPAAINIYGDKVAIIHWNKEQPFAILINHEDISRGYKNHFNALWNLAKN